MSVKEINQMLAAIYSGRRQTAERIPEEQRRRLLERRKGLRKAYEAFSSAQFQQMGAYVEAGVLTSEAKKDEIKSKADAAAAEARENWEQAKAALEAEGTPWPEKQYFCTLCEDRGRLADGNLCPNCYAKTLRQAVEKLYPGLLPDPEARFEHFDLGLFSEEPVMIHNQSVSPRAQMEQNLRQAKAFAEAFPEDKTDFFFTGKTGTGKTYLASCVLNALLDRGFAALLFTMMQFEEIVGTYRLKQQTYGVKPEELEAAEKRYRLLKEADFMVLDDFGAGAGLLGHTAAELNAILQERKKRGLPSLLTSNLSLRQLQEATDERFLSRLLEHSTVRPFLGADLRLKMARSSPGERA